MTTKTLVYIEISNNKIEKVSKEIAAHFLNNFSSGEVIGVVMGCESEIQSVTDELKEFGTDKIYVIQNEILKDFNVTVYADLLSQLINNIKPDILLMGATSNGRELAPRVASKLQIGLTADCTDLQISQDNKLLATRPTYGGKMMATIISKTLPNFATVRPGALAAKFASDKTPEILYFDADLANISDTVSCIEVINTLLKEQAQDWTGSEIIIAGGLGLKSKENFERLYSLCDLLGAKPAASRAAVELGWAPQSIQVGQTGNSVSPKLYIAMGISGALQHMIGINNAQTILAVNIDKTAPIMSCADISITADATAVIEAMIKNISD